jgi:asparagine synthase (glutamine-hydrolysing)
MQLYRESRQLASQLGSDRWDLVAWRLGIWPAIPDPAVSIWRRLRGRKQQAWPPDALIRPEFAKRIGFSDYLVDLNGSQRRTRSPREEHLRCMSSGLLTTALELLDKTAARAGVEARFPFCDRRLMAFCLSLPVTMKLRRGVGRFVLRSAMQGVLPEDVRCRPHKGHIGANFCQALLKHDGPLLEEVFAKHLSAIDEYVDTAALQQAYYRYRSNPRRNRDDALTVFMISNLALWMAQGGV